MKPVFIFSLPRAGSTLLQRILTAHSKISSTSEPWILLPFIYARKEVGGVTEYSHFCSHRAINEFIETLPEKDSTYNSLLNELIIELYEKQSREGDLYFIDKTPRYYLIIPEIMKIFPDAKFIFLFRNPAHVFSSIISTFGQGTLKKLHGYHVDFQSGPEDLASGYNLLKDKAYRLQYEDFIVSPESYIEEIFNYLEIKQEPDVLTRFAKTNLSGSMGDPTGVKKYSTISTNSLLTWSEVIDSKVKRYLLKNSIQSIKEEVFEIHGYSKTSVIDEVNQISVAKIGFKDLLDLVLSYFIRVFNLNLFFSKDGKWSRGKYLS